MPYHVLRKVVEKWQIPAREGPRAGNQTPFCHAQSSAVNFPAYEDEPVGDN